MSQPFTPSQPGVPCLIFLTIASKCSLFLINAFGPPAPQALPFLYSFSPVIGFSIPSCINLSERSYFWYSATPSSKAARNFSYQSLYCFGYFSATALACFNASLATLLNSSIVFGHSITEPPSLPSSASNNLLVTM